MRPLHHFPSRRPRVQWLMLAGDVLGAVFLAAFMFSLPWVLPYLAALIFGVTP